MSFKSRLKKFYFDISRPYLITICGTWSCVENKTFKKLKNSGTQNPIFNKRIN